MENVVFFLSKEVKAKGLNKQNVIDSQRLSNYIFPDELRYLQNLESISHNLPSNPTLFYPGCGSDILFPLHFLEKLSPQVSVFTFIFADTENSLDFIKTILDDIGVHFSETEDIEFYWKDMLVKLKFIRRDVFSFDAPRFDIYFERKFRIMKDQDNDYENRIYKKLNDNGILISDSGFGEFPLKKQQLPSQLSSYGQMIMGFKIP